MAMRTGRSDGAGDDDAPDATLLADINVTPLVDVMLVLLIIFMVTAPLMMAGVPLHLPKTSAARQSAVQHPTVLSLDAAGHVFIGDEAVPEADLPPRLQALAASMADKPVYVRADQALAYGQVMHLLGEIASAGLPHIALLSVRDGGRKDDAH